MTALLRLRRPASRASVRLLVVAAAAALASPAAAQQYWRTDGTAGTITDSTYGTSAAGPFTNTFLQNVEIDYTANSFVTGATTNVGNIVVADGFTVTFTAGGTLGTNGTVRTLTVGTGSILDLAGQSLSTAAGTGFIKNGAGILFSSNGNTYAGGFTLNAGTVIVGGVNAMGGGGALTINGGTIAANATRDLSSKYTGGIVIGGDFTLGGTTTGVASGNAAAASNLTFSDATNLGASTRTITIGGTGTYAFNGVISGAAGVGLSVVGSATSTGSLSLGGANTFTGGVSVDRTAAANAILLRIGNDAALGTGPLNVGLNANYGTAYVSGGGAFLLVNTAGASTVANNIALPNAPTTRYYALAKATLGTNLTLTGVISGGGANTVLQLDTPNSGDATTNFTLAGANTLAGQVRLNRGSLTLTNAQALGSASLLLASNANAAGNLRFAGSFTLPNAITVSTSTDAVSTAGNDVTLSGALTVASGVTWVKTGAGTLTLAGANAIAGTTSVTGGNLLVTGTVGGSGGLAVGGGTFSYAGATNQTFTGLAVNAGGSAVTIANGSAAALNLGAITRSIGGTVDFAAPSGTITTTTGNTNGILGGYATFGGTTWAVGSPDGSTATPVTGLATYTTTSTAGTPATNYANANIDVNVSQAPDAAIAPNSLRFNTAAATTLTLTDTANTVVSGGILVTAAAGANTSAITGGTLLAPSAGDLRVIQNNTAAGLTIGSVLGDNGGSSLTKSGPGLLTLANAANTYTGKTYLNGGTTNIAADASLGAAPAAAVADQLTFNGGVLQLAAAFDLAATRGITVNVNNGTIDTQAFASTYGGVAAGSGGLTKLGGGTLTLTGTNTYTGPTTVTVGTLQIGAGGTVGSIAAASPISIGASASVTFFRADTALTIANALSGTGALNFNGTGTTGQSAYTLTGTNTGYSGLLTATNARVQAGAATALGGATLATGTNGQFFLTAGTYPNAFTVAGIGWSEAAGQLGAIRFSGGAVVSGPVTLTGDTRLTAFAAGDTGTISGVVSGNFNVEKTGAGRLILTAANTYGGTTTINAGTIQALNSAALSTGNVVVGSGALYGTAYASGGTPFLAAGTGTTAITVANAVALPGTAGYYAVQRSGTAGGLLVLSGNLSGGLAGTGNGTGNPTGTVLQLDSPNGGDSTSTIQLSGDNSGLTAGQVRLNRGVVILDSANALGSATLYVASNANAAGNVRFNGSFTLPNAITVATASDTISTNGNNVTLSGVLTSAVAISKVGTGTLTLSGTSNAISATLTVGSGTLLVTGNTGTSAGTIAVSSGATLAGTGIVNGPITAASGGTLRPGTPGATGTLNSAAAVTLVSGSVFGVRIDNTGSLTPYTTTLGVSGTPGTDNNSLSSTGTLTIPASGLIVTTDGTGTAFAPNTTYSYQIGQGSSVAGITAGTPFTSFTFTPTGFAASSYSLNSNGSNLFLNFTTSSVPEPAMVLGLAAAAFGVLRLRRRNRAGG